MNLLAHTNNTNILLMFTGTYSVPLTHVFMLYDLILLWATWLIIIIITTDTALYSHILMLYHSCFNVIWSSLLVCRFDTCSASALHLHIRTETRGCNLSFNDSHCFTNKYCLKLVSDAIMLHWRIGVICCLDMRLRRPCFSATLFCQWTAAWSAGRWSHSLPPS